MRYGPLTSRVILFIYFRKYLLMVIRVEGVFIHEKHLVGVIICHSERQDVDQRQPIKLLSYSVDREYNSGDQSCHSV